MLYEGKIWIGDSQGKKINILPRMANRHGLITGATGTGKTTTLRVLAESFSDAGVPVFLADIKGDLSGLCKKGESSEKIDARIQELKLENNDYSFQEYPVNFWDLYGEKGIPLRTTVTEMGPVLLSKIMQLNNTQTEILTVLFKIADDQELLLLDTKDLKAMLQYMAENADELSLNYGNIAKQSIAAIVRHVVALESQGGEQFFSDPALNIADWFTTDISGRGKINILDATKLVSDPTMYSAFLLWMLSEMFETLPEVGDLDKPRMIFFFDEAHLLFGDISKNLQEKLEQIIKLIRSKGVGIYFITQSPKDIPDGVLAQLGNKIQHALRAYTPTEEKAIKTIANSFRTNPDFDTAKAISELGTGEALISVLDEEGIPTVVEKCKILPPRSRMTVLSDEEIRNEIQKSDLFLKYRNIEDRDSAYEFFLRQRRLSEENKPENKAEEKTRNSKQLKSTASKAASSAGGTIGREIGNAFGKSIGGSFGKKLGGNVGASIGRSILGTLFK